MVFCPLLKMGENISKKFNKNLSSKYSPKLLDHTEQSAADALKTASKERFKKQQKQLKIADKITRVSKNSPQNNSETNEEEI